MRLTQTKEAVNSHSLPFSSIFGITSPGHQPRAEGGRNEVRMLHLLSDLEDFGRQVARDAPGWCLTTTLTSSLGDPSIDSLESVPIPGL